MRFKLSIESGLYPENQFSKTLSQVQIRPEMDCFDYKNIETYFNDLTKDIKVDNSIDDWILSIRIYLGGAMNEKEIAIGKRGVAYLIDKEKEVYIRISLPTSDEINWGITKRHRFNEYSKRKTDKGITVMPVDYNQFKNMTDYIENSIKLALKRALADGITLKGQTIKI